MKAALVDEDQDQTAGPVQANLGSALILSMHFCRSGTEKALADALIYQTT